MLDGGGEDGVRDTGGGAREVVLRIGEGGTGVEGFELAARGMEGAELDGDAGADAEEGGESAFVEGERAFVFVDGGHGGEGGGVARGGLKADLHDIYGRLARDFGGRATAAGRQGGEKRRGGSCGVIPKGWPMRTCATPPTAPAKRSFSAWLLGGSGWGMGSSAMVVRAQLQLPRAGEEVDVYEGGGCRAGRKMRSEICGQERP